MLCVSLVSYVSSYDWFWLLVAANRITVIAMQNVDISDYSAFGKQLYNQA